MEEKIVIRIDAPSLPQISKRPAFKRVAAYARVSTSSEEQLNSVEAQKSYYKEYIGRHKEWVFAGLYTDEGISGLSYLRREGFNLMINDAYAGKIDLIVTKSISRFARNTVDTLTHIRRLKEKGIAVYFEKEDINTLDAKGEFMITLLSSMAQEESRSISDNVKWGYRKRMADGKYHVAYSRFLGYTKGNTTLEIDEKEAEIARYIYYLFFAGKTDNYIAEKLNSQKIASPGSGKKWSPSTIRSILTNEKYCGNALLQKTFVPDFLTKKEQKNHGELPKYFVQHGHDPIIDPVVWDEVQSMKQAHDITYSGCTIYSHKLRCSICGRFYRRRVRRGPSYPDVPAVYYHCRGKYDPECRCKNAVIYEQELDELSSAAIIHLLHLHEKRIATLIRTEIKKHIVPDRQNHVLSQVTGLLASEDMEFAVSDIAKEIIINQATLYPDNTIIFEMRNGGCIQETGKHKTPCRDLWKV